MKLKKIPKEYFTTILDRLTRFEPAYMRYDRVFDDIINKFCLEIKTKDIDLATKIKISEEIFNSSLSSISANTDINKILINLEDKYFVYNELSYQYLSSRLFISDMLNEIDEKNIISKNLLWIKNVNDYKDNIFELRKKNSLLYPIEKIILCEGQTEYTLLNTIFKLYDINLDKLGIMVIPAGGKNQVARKYYSMIEYTKLPFFILLDKDASQTRSLIEPKLRAQDKIYLLKSGEFEDLIPTNVLFKTVNYIHQNEFNCLYDDFDKNASMVENLENVYKKYGFGEFKKAQFALELKNFIEKYLTKDDFFNTEFETIVKSL